MESGCSSHRRYSKAKVNETKNVCALPPKPNTSIGFILFLSRSTPTTSRMDRECYSIKSLIDHHMRQDDVLNAGCHVKQLVVMVGNVLLISFIKDYDAIFKPTSSL